MRDPEEYQEEQRAACAKCRAAYKEQIEALDAANIDLNDKVTDLEDKLAQAEARYAQLVETVSTRTDQRQSMADPRD